MGDVLLDHHIDRAAGHDQVLDVVAADQYQPAAAIEVRLLHDVEPLLPAAA